MDKDKKVHGEIIYTKENGMSIHSDICPPDHSIKDLDEDTKKFYHDCLDEWLEKSKGSGIFYLREEGFRDYGNEEEGTPIICCQNCHEEKLEIKELKKEIVRLKELKRVSTR